MSNQVAKKLHNQLTFSFPTIFHGRGVIITIYGKEGQYGVLIDGDEFAQVKFESNYHSWFVAKGELNDPDLVKEIGERIEAKLN
jgi:hypothetical protein